MTITMDFSSGNRENKRDWSIPKGGEVAETVHDRRVEFNGEFKPIEHPLEPSDEDHPVKCPMPNSSVLNDGETHDQNVESLHKRAEFIVANVEGTIVGTEPNAHAVRKRHQTLTRNGSRPSFLRAPPSSILEMLQECDKFEPPW